MYTDKKNILQLAALLEAYGITRVVLCPGSRNARIVDMTPLGLVEITRKKSHPTLAEQFKR